MKAKDPPTGVNSWLHMLYTRLYVLDMDAVSRYDETVMRIRNNGEEFYMPAEFCFANMQVWPFGCHPEVVYFDNTMYLTSLALVHRDSMLGC